MHKNIWTIISALQYSGTVAAALLCSSYSKLTRIFVIIVNLGAISWSHEQTVGTLAAYYQTRCESFDGVYISFSCNNMKMGLRVTKKYKAAYLEVPLYLIVTLWRYDTNFENIPWVLRPVFRKRISKDLKWWSSFELPIYFLAMSVDCN